MSASRYSKVATVLHWCIAVGIIAMLISGLVIYQEWLTDATLFAWFQWHKSLGLILLILITLRVLWRLFHSPPKPPSSLSAKQIRTSSFGHLTLYSLLIFMPLSGWLMVSTSELQIPTLVFNLFKWPHLPVPESLFKISQTLSSNLHSYGSLIFAACILGHISMVIKHYKQDLNLLERMPLSLQSLSIIAIAAFTILLLSISNNSSTPASNPSTTSTTQIGEIRFTGVHAGNTFGGQFKQWTLKTNFNPKNQSLSNFELVIDTNSFATGNTFYDETLNEKDWFDPETYPQISFISSDINQLDSITFKISGKLSIKDIQTQLEFKATINEKNRLDTNFQLSRLTLGLGVNADPDAEWVDENIQLTAWSQLN